MRPTATPGRRGAHRTVGIALAATLTLAVGACGQTTAPLETSTPSSLPLGAIGAPISSTGNLATSTSQLGVPMFPLTGQLIEDPNLAHHPAAVVKIDNHPDARPHTGLTKADIVYELKVEGITRFAAIYHSEDADPVGPVRSARSSDIQILSNLNRPLLLWSGANGGVTAQVKGAEQAGLLIDVSDEVARNDYFRDNRRQAPHNLYAHIGPIRKQLELLNGPPPAPMFTYRDLNGPMPPTAIDAHGMGVDFGGGLRVNWVWDAERGGWDRFQVDERHPEGRDAFVDTQGGQVSPNNVLILFTEYGVSEVDARSPKAYTVGQGGALLLTNGKAIGGTWKRETDISTPTLTDYDGNPILLTPGRTWIELAPAGGTGALPILEPEAQKLLSRRG